MSSSSSRSSSYSGEVSQVLSRRSSVAPSVSRSGASSGRSHHDRQLAATWSRSSSRASCRGEADSEEKCSQLTAVMADSLSRPAAVSHSLCVAKVSALQTAINALEAKLSAAEREGRDEHRVKLIKSLRNQLRESLTENSALLDLALSQGASREVIDDKISRALSKVKLTGVKRVSEMRREIGMLQYELKKAQERRVIVRTVPADTQAGNDSGSDRQSQYQLEAESARSESVALTHRLSLTLAALDALKDKFSALHAENRELKRERAQLTSEHARAEELEAELAAQSASIASASVAHDEAASMKSQLGAELQRMRAREERWKQHETEMRAALKRAQHDNESLAQRLSRAESVAEEREEQLEHVQQKLTDTKNQLARTRQHRREHEDDDREDLLRANQALHEKCERLAAAQRQRSIAEVKASVCAHCPDLRATVAALRSESSLLRMRAEAREQDTESQHEAREVELEAHTVLIEGYERERARLLQHIAQIERKPSVSAAKAAATESSSESEGDSASDSDSDGEAGSLGALTAEFLLDL